MPQKRFNTFRSTELILTKILHVLLTKIDLPSVRI